MIDRSADRSIIAKKLLCTIIDNAPVNPYFHLNFRLAYSSSTQRKLTPKGAAEKNAEETKEEFGWQPEGRRPVRNGQQRRRAPSEKRVAVVRKRSARPQNVRADV